MSNTLTPEEQQAYDTARAYKNLAVVAALTGGVAMALCWALGPTPIWAIVGGLFGMAGITAAHWCIAQHDHAIVEFTLMVARSTFQRNMDAILTYGKTGLNRATDEATAVLEEKIDEQ